MQPGPEINLIMNARDQTPLGFKNVAYSILNKFEDIGYAQLYFRTKTLIDISISRNNFTNATKKIVCNSKVASLWQ